MKLATACVACLPRRELSALIDAGCLSKGEITAINALRAGDQTGELAKRRVFSAVHKQFAESTRQARILKRAIESYARQRAEQMTKEANMSMIEKMLNMSEATLMIVCKTDGIPSAAHAHALLTELAKRRQKPGETKEQAYARVVTDGGLGSLLMQKHQELTRGWSVPGQEEALHKLVEHPIRKLGGGLKQNTHQEWLDSFKKPLRGTAGYDSSIDGRPPRNPDAGEDVTIHDQNQLLEDIKSGKVPFSDPRVSALHRLERKMKFGS